MKIPRALLFDPKPALTRKMRRAARAIGKATSAFIVGVMSGEIPAIPDPACAAKKGACGKCWSCRRAKDGPEWWLQGPAYPPPKRRRR